MSASNRPDQPFAFGPPLNMTVAVPAVAERSEDALNILPPGVKLSVGPPEHYARAAAPPAPPGEATTPARTVTQDRLDGIAYRLANAATLVPRRDGVEAITDTTRADIEWLRATVVSLMERRSELVTQVGQLEGGIAEMNARLAALSAEAEGLRQDKERLDWLEERQHEFFSGEWTATEKWIVVELYRDARTIMGSAFTLREALDAARARPRFERCDAVLGDSRCTMERSHGGDWHDDGQQCWPASKSTKRSGRADAVKNLTGDTT